MPVIEVLVCERCGDRVDLPNPEGGFVLLGTVFLATNQTGKVRVEHLVETTSILKRLCPECWDDLHRSIDTVVRKARP